MPTCPMELETRGMLGCWVLGDARGLAFLPTPPGLSLCQGRSWMLSQGCRKGRVTWNEPLWWCRGPGQCRG